MQTSFPRTSVAGVSLPRMLIGTNWIFGYSHSTRAASNRIKAHHSDAQTIADLLKAYLEHDIDALMAPVVGNDLLLDAVKMAEGQTGKKITLIATPGIDISDTREGRAEAYRAIESARKAGSTFCLLHHGSVEQLICKRTHTIDRLPQF